jgi:hypothetical protein
LEKLTKTTSFFSGGLLIQQLYVYIYVPLVTIRRTVFLGRNFFKFTSLFIGVITFSSMIYRPVSFCPSRTTTSTKKEHQTTIFTYFAPFRQSNSCKDLNALTQFQKLPKYPHLKNYILCPQRLWVAREPPLRPGWAASHPRGGRSHLWGWLAGHPATSGVAAATPFPSVFFLIY